MALTLTINGVNALPYAINSSYRIVEQIQGGRANALNFQLARKSGEVLPVAGQEIVLKDGSRFLFGGFLTRLDPLETGVGALFQYQIEATDYTYALINHKAEGAYENKTCAYIVADLLTQWLPGWGFDTTNVQTGPTVERIVFNHIPLSQAFEKLASYANFEWWIDYEKKIYFQAKTTTAAPETFTDSTRNHESIDINIDASQVRNRITVQGGTQKSSSSTQQVFYGDATATKNSFILQAKPKQMVSIEYDSGGGSYVAQAYGVDNIDDTAGNFAMFSYEEKYVRLVSGTLSATQRIRVTYYYDVNVIIELDDAESIVAMQAIEGASSDGVHDYSIVDTSIETVAEARTRAVKELEEYAYPLVNAYAKTRTSLLAAASYFKPGQLLTVNLPSWGISSDSTYLIQEVTTAIEEGDAGIEYRYDIRFGGRLLNALVFIESLAAQKTIIDADEQLSRIRRVKEQLGIVETVTRNTVVHAFSEQVGIVETVTKRNVGTFLWETTGSNGGKWDLAEWA